MTFLLLLDADEATRRSGDEPDRIEREGGDFRRAVETAYRELAGIFPQRVVPLDGSRPPEEIAKEVRGRLPGLP